MTEEISSTNGLPIDLESYVDQWDDFVRECENGCALSVDDYANGLSMREIIQEKTETAPLTLAAKIKSEVELIDDRFMRATIPVVNHLIEASN